MDKHREGVDRYLGQGKVEASGSGKEENEYFVQRKKEEQKSLKKYFSCFINFNLLFYILNSLYLIVIVIILQAAWMVHHVFISGISILLLS